jgi:ribosome biogenesis GTPase A
MRASLDGDGDDGIGSSSLSLELKQLSERRAARKKEERKAALREKVRAANRALRAAGGGIAAAAGGDDDRIDEEEAEALAADEAHEHSDEEAADEQAVAANARQFSGALGVLEEDDHDSSKQQRRDDFITLGCIGQPNAGKSSLINALAGRKLLSVSIAPGHTKYLQTLFLNRATRLCDCPGLIAPATATGMPKAVQVLSGHFPIAQTRDPYSAVQFLAERMPLETIYKLSPPASSLHPPPAATSSASDSLAAPTSATIQQQQQQQQHPPPFEWSAWAICEGVAQKKGFFNRQGAPDVYRAANLILREVLDGKIALYFTPPKD